MKKNNLYRNKSVSDYLFHFTGLNDGEHEDKTDEDAFNVLLLILRDRLLKYSTRKRNIIFKIDPKTSINNIPIPMVCLTETPINKLENHILQYNAFGLGLSVDWGIKNGGMNVIYYDNDHPTIYGEAIIQLLKPFFDPSIPKLNTPLLVDQVLAGITEDIKYRDEREWRFIKKPNESANLSVNDLGIRFDFNDLKYLFVKSFDYKLKLKKWLIEDPYWRNKKGIKIIVNEKKGKQSS
ncbi:abortive infection system antitoxin AbiGi family protein [Leptospira levettii]|uniref:abortive infection system antitoxin AbiGi family protein n=1 Tax=Leptospira levettii TaxID=2023178 RepID=UPI00223DBB14|nr:abortive infection system antitoxin AbiGi family protein [Leptospira levettii]MCW7509762.1 abortive infection system antitoxin AbiGi family protein [Leptospira levettii]MCW7520849.1 abortive infection system antitoxin AbiGi family protein [Leptospira levettii]